MAECYTLEVTEDANLFLFPDPQALQDVMDAHIRLDDPNEPLILSATDYATYVEMVA